MRRLTIEGREIGDDTDAYVIAEIGNNHQGDLKTCMEMFRVAKECGADAVKLQKRDNKRLYPKEIYDKPYDNENSYGRTYGEHREALEFGFDEYSRLRSYAAGLGITMFSTAFDEHSVNFLTGLRFPAFKVASGDLTNIPLLRHIVQAAKPRQTDSGAWSKAKAIILSTGGGKIEDVEAAHDIIKEVPHCILQCTAAYPAPFHLLDLRVIETYRALFPDTVIGLSAHDNGIAMAVAAYVLGARVIEKHFTLNRASKGTDHAFSLEPSGLKKMIRDLRRTRLALGDGIKKFYDSERGPISKMRSVEWSGVKE